MQSRSSHYVFSLKAEDLWRTREKRSRLYLGKLRAASSYDYIMYDNGICAAPEDPDSLLDDLESKRGLPGDPRDNPVAKKMERDAKASGGSDDVSLYRRELAVIHLNTKSRPAPPGTRGMEVCIPQVHSPNPLHADPKAASSSSSSASSTAGSPKVVYNIEKPFQKIRAENKQNEMYAQTCLVAHERTSRYDPLSSCLVDFKGRANIASVKNAQFVISDPLNPSLTKEDIWKIDGEKEFILQVGKVRPLSSTRCIHTYIYVDDG